MSFFDFLKTDDALAASSAGIAKERLKIVVAHQRYGSNALAEKLPAMKDDIIAIVKKYAKISANDVTIKIDETTDNMTVLDIDVLIPEISPKAIRIN